MTLTYELKIEGEYAYVTTSGTLQTPEEALTYIQALVNDLEAKGIDNALLDHRQITGNLDGATSSSIAVNLMENVQGLKGLRLAIVTSEQRLQLLKFFETVAQNRGLMVLAFDRMDEARHWLTG